MSSGAPSFAELVERAESRGFAGLMLDGVDVDAAIDGATQPALLARAIEIADRGHEKYWAERLSGRLCACDPEPVHAMKRAERLALLGRLDEAGRVIESLPREAAEEPYRRACGVLLAKRGAIDEALAIFETLSGRKAGAHPDPLVLTAAQEMISDCAVADTKKLMLRLAEQYPAHILVRGLLLRCHLYDGELEEARKLAQPPESEWAAATEYERRVFIESIAEMYELLGWTRTLFEFLRDAIAKDPTHWSLYGQAGIAARLISRDKDYSELVAAIPDTSRDTAEAKAILFRWHVEAGRHAEGASLVDDLRSLSAPLFLNANLFLKAHARDGTLVDAALDDCRRCRIPLLGPVLGFSLHAYYYDCSPDRLRQSLAELEPFVLTSRTRAVFWFIYLRCLIGLGEIDRALAHYRSLPAGLANAATLKPFGMYFDTRQGKHDQVRADWVRYLRSTRHPCVNAQSSYPSTVDLKYSGSPGDVLLFLPVHNGADYLGWFLDHYRSLGVDHFFVVDNASTDGTLQRLKSEPDVSVFFNGDSFGRSGFGVLWINHLMQRFGVGHWCFHVDVDEGFVFPGSDNGRSLKELIAYCDDRGYGLVPAIALDMYPERVDARAGSDPFAASCYFDTDYLRIPAELPPYAIVQGGIRRRMTGLACAMHKSPLVRVSPDVRYIECSHGTTHLPVADVWGAMLHYKFVGDIRRRFADAIARGEHFGEAITYRRLSESVQAAAADGFLLSSFSRRYTGPSLLVELGLLPRSDAWGG